MSEIPPPSEPVRTAEIELIEVRKAFAPIFKWLSIAVIALIVLAVVAMLFPLLFSELPATEKALVVQLIQVGLGMILGYASVFFGVVMSWLGITAAFSTELSGDGAVGRGKVSLQSAGPGLALLIGGLILIGASLYKPIRYSETLQSPETQVQPDSAPPGV